METKVCAKPMYKCGLCGAVHDDVVSRAHCKIYCNNKRVEEEKKAAEAKKKEEYNARIEEVNMAFEKAYELRNKFVEDYGSYKYQRKCNSIDECNSSDDVLNFLFGE